MPRGVGAVISPPLARVATGGEAPFVVRVAGKPVESWTWLVNDVPGGDDVFGTIADGVYHSPAAAPVPNEVHIEARPVGGGRSLFATVIVGRSDLAYTLRNRWELSHLTEGRVEEAHGICLDRSGNVVVTDPTLDRVHRYTLEGKFLDEIGFGPGTGPGFFEGPRDAKVDRKGRIYVVDGTSDALVRFDPSGEIIIGKAQESAKGRLNRPHALDLDASGRVYVADVDNGRVAVFDQDCRFLMGWPTPPVGTKKRGAPHGIGVDANGDVFVADYNGVCFKYTARGEWLFSFADTGNVSRHVHGQVGERLPRRSRGA